MSDDILLIRVENDIQSTTKSLSSLDELNINTLIQTLNSSGSVKIIEVETKDLFSKLDNLFSTPYRSLLFTANGNVAQVLSETLSNFASKYQKVVVLATLSASSARECWTTILGMSLGIALVSKEPGLHNVPLVSRERPMLRIGLEKNKWLLESGNSTHYADSEPVFDNNKWLLQKGSGTHYFDSEVSSRASDTVGMVNQWLASSLQKPESTMFQVETFRKRCLEEVDLDKWLSKPVKVEEEESETFSSISVSQLEKSSSIQSCDMVQDIEELKICPSNNGAISNRPTNSTPQSVKSSSSWLKVICQDSEPCNTMSECKCDPNCTATLLQSPTRDDSTHPKTTQLTALQMFNLPFQPDQWLKSNNASIISPSLGTVDPVAKITEKGKLMFPSVKEFDLWLTPTKKAAEESWFMNSQSRIFFDDGLKSDSFSDH